jgi:hypothetical protein
LLDSLLLPPTGPSAASRATTPAVIADATAIETSSATPFTTPLPPTPVPTVGVLAGEWRRTSQAPILGRVDHTMVWTGSEALIWGGTESSPEHPIDEQRLPRHGAAYDPAADRWRLIPDAPISGRTYPVVAWSVDELLVWGGWQSDATGGLRAATDGAVYSPSRDRWRVIRRSGLSGDGAVGGFVAGWLVVATNAGAARYDPVADRWVSLIPAPIRQNGRIAVVAADRLVVIAFGDGASGQAEVAILDPVNWRWSTLGIPFEPVDLGLVGVGAAGRVIFPEIPWNEREALHKFGRSLDLGLMSWQTITPCPRAAGGATWTGRYVLGVQGSYDARTDTCLALPAAPRRDPPFSDTNGREVPVAVWTGREYFTWSGGTGRDTIWVPADGAAFRPAVDLSG